MLYDRINSLPDAEVASLDSNSVTDCRSLYMNWLYTRSYIYIYIYTHTHTHTHIRACTSTCGHGIARFLIWRQANGKVIRPCISDRSRQPGVSPSGRYGRPNSVVSPATNTPSPAPVDYWGVSGGSPVALSIQASVTAAVWRRRSSSRRCPDRDVVPSTDLDGFPRSTRPILVAPCRSRAACL